MLLLHIMYSYVCVHVWSSNYARCMSMLFFPTDPSCELLLQPPILTSVMPGRLKSEFLVGNYGSLLMLLSINYMHCSLCQRLDLKPFHITISFMIYCVYAYLKRLSWSNCATSLTWHLVILNASLLYVTAMTWMHSNFCMMAQNTWSSQLCSPSTLYMNICIILMLCRATSSRFKFDIWWILVYSFNRLIVFILWN
jgi:hypothetical protein